VARNPELDELERSVRILAHEPPIDVSLQHEIGAVVADQRHSVGDVILVDEMLGPLQPVRDRREEPLVEHARGRVDPGRQGGHRPLVGLEEEAGLGSEVLEDRALRDPELDGHRLHLRALVPLLGGSRLGRGVSGSGRLSVPSPTKGAKIGR
jgi:hypothetical protein